jgi:hypothetical protein
MVEQKDPRIDLEEQVKKLAPGQFVELFEAFLGKAEPRIESAISKALPSAVEQALRRVGYTEEIAGLLHMLAARSNDDKESTLMKALTLYGLALDALEKGNRMAILSPDDEIVHDVIGVGTAQSNPQPVAG